MVRSLAPLPLPTHLGHWTGWVRRCLNGFFILWRSTFLWLDHWHPSHFPHIWIIGLVECKCASMGFSSYAVLFQAESCSWDSSPSLLWEPVFKAGVEIFPTVWNGLYCISSTFKDAVFNLYFVAAIHKLYVGEKECWKHHEPEQCDLKSRTILESYYYVLDVCKSFKL